MEEQDVGKSAGPIDGSLTVTNTDLNLNSHQFSGTSHADKALETGHAREQSENLPQLLETSEPVRATKNVKCNLRKSLAWDSAFFTSAGVLDAEELSTMIEGSEKGEKNFLPGIQEDVHASMDSISTLESDNLTLESLEAELFEDIRASIQKSSRASNIATISSIAAAEGKNLQAKASSTSKKVDIAARNRHMQKAGAKNLNAVMTGSGKIMKQSNSAQVTQPVMRNKESTTSIPRPTKSIHKVNPMPSVATKRASLSANHLKVETNANSTSVRLKATQASKAVSLVGPRRGLPKSSSSSKPSSLASSNASKIESRRPSSSHGSSGSSSDNVGKSAATSARRNNSKVYSSGPIPKTPSRASPGCKLSAPTPGLAVHVISSKLSSSISPASSISEWSVESSSSTSTANQMSTSRASIDASNSCRSSNGDLDFNTHVAEKPSEQNRNQRSEASSQNLKKATAQTNSLSRPDSMKPSGLRMPSPKIGFFDGSKSVRTPNGGMQSQARLSTGLPKLAPGVSSPIGNSSKAKLGKVPPTKVVKANTNLKPDIRSSASHTQAKELPSPLAKSTTVSKDAKDCPVKSSVIQPELGEPICLEIEPERESRKLEISNNEISVQETAGLKETVIPFSEGKITDSALDTCVAEIKLHGGVEDTNYLKSKSPAETNEKAADNIDDSTRDFVDMELQLAMENEVAGNTNSCCELMSSNPCALEVCSKQNFIDVLEEESTTDLKEKESTSDFKEKESTTDLKEIVIIPSEGNVFGLNLDTCVGNIKPQSGDEDAIHGQDGQANWISAETKEMETDPIEDQNDDLAATDVIDKNVEIAQQNVIADCTKSFCDLSCSNPSAPEFGCAQNFIDVQKDKLTADFMEIVIPLQEGGVVMDSSLDTCDGDAIHGQDNHKNKLSGEMKEMETDPFETEIDDLALIDVIAKDFQKMIVDSTNSCSALSCSTPFATVLGFEQNFINVEKEKPTADYKEIVNPIQEGVDIIDSSLDTFDSKINPHEPGEYAIREDDLKNKEKLTADFKEIVIPLQEGGVVMDSSLDTCDGYAIHGQVDHKNKLSGEMKEMETDPFETEIDDLVLIDVIAKDFQKMIVDSANSFSGLSCSTPFATVLSFEQNCIDVEKEKPTTDSKEIVFPLQEGVGVINSSLDTFDSKINSHEPGERAIWEDDLKNKAGKVGEKENNPFGDQVDDLVSNFVSMDLKCETQKEIGGSCSDLCSLEFCSEKNLVEVQEGPTAESVKLNCSNPCDLGLCSEKNYLEVQNEEPAVNSRAPLVEKNSLYSEGFDILTGSIIEAVEKTGSLPFSEITQKENS